SGPAVGRLCGGSRRPFHEPEIHGRVREVNRSVLLDTGPLVALLDRRDGDHRWVVEQMARLRRPLYTCEAVITEAFHLLRHLAQARTAVLEMLAEDVLRVSFQLR